MIVPARGPERGRILSSPRPYPENPYVGRLADALAAEGISTVAGRHIEALVARPNGAHWLHLHWPEWRLRSPHRGLAVARLAWFERLLDRVRRSGIQLAWTAHNLVGHDEPHEDLARRGRAALLARCDLVFGHFAEVESDVRALGFRGRFTLTPHPGFNEDVPPMPSRSAARRALGYAPDEIVLLAFGAIEPYKGLDRLVSAFRATRAPKLRLHIAGAPRSRAASMDLASAALDDPRVRTEMRYVDPEQAAIRFAAADAAVFAYRAFYTSGAAMLALSHGTPIVGAPMHHFRAFAGEPFFVPMDRLDDLEGAAMRAAAIPHTAREAARKYASAQTWARMASSIAREMFPRGGA